MPKIIQLSSHVADLIAAGEVVERPASVVKELTENSIDAGAKNVTVEIQNGGMTFLRILDDGCGIAPEDAETAFLRHATSKIRQEKDLESIGTLGFRGEALAATAAVSKIDLLTRTAENQEGVRLHLEAGKVLSREPAGCPVGTTLIVRDLFYNTPARMKFMKRDSQEASAVFSAVQKQALAHPDISFRFIKDGDEQLHTPGDGKLQSAIYSVLGRQSAMEMVEVQSQWEKITVSGFVSRPTATRGTRSYQIFFVNGRYVRSKTMSAALEEAYRNQIMVGRFPACVLNLSIPLSAVDVNVHPAKTEVKFLNDREIFDCVHYGVKAALNRAPGQLEMKINRPKARTAQTEEEKPRQNPSPEPGATTRQGFPARPLRALPELPEEKPKSAPAPKQDFYRTMDAAQYRQFAAALCETPKVKPSQSVVKAVFQPEQTKDAPMLVREEVRVPLPGKEAPQPEILIQQELPMQERPWRVVGEVLETYIIVELDKTVLFIDKHAAHERILFEKLKQNQQGIMGQCLMVPVTCCLDLEEAAVLTQNKELLFSLGYDIDDMGDGTLLLRQLPAELMPEEGEASLAELAGHLLNGKKDSPEAIRDELLHSIACKAAIKAGYHTTPKEREDLVQQVLTRDDLKYCPHGRPICITLSQRQLEKQFKRIQ